MAAASPLLEVEGLCVDIETPSGRLHAVSDVSFSVAAGETLCIVGESGCGKTMTALSIMRLLPRRAEFTARRVSFEGRDLARLSDREMSALRGNRIGMIFQDPMTALNPVLSIGRQLEEVWLRHRSGGVKAARDRAEHLLARCGVPDPRSRLGQYPHELSGGLRQRMMIAMMLMCEPALVIADEPTTALDVTVQVQILQLLRSLQDEMGMGLVLITHNLGVVARVADRVAVMYGGRIVEAAEPAALFGTPRHPYTRGLLACVPDLSMGGERLGSIPGVVPSLIGALEGCAFRNRCSEARPECAMGLVDLRMAAPHHAYRCLLPPDFFVEAPALAGAST